MNDVKDFVSINPWNGAIVFEKSSIGLEKCKSTIRYQYEYWRKEWSCITAEQRARKLFTIPLNLKEQLAFYASVITQETGKPIDQSIAEIEKCIQLCEWYLEHGVSFLRSGEVHNASRSSGVMFQPGGIVLGIMPWNFPFWQVFRYAFCNLLAGNVVALKPAPSVGWSALLLQNIMGDFPGFHTYFCGHELIPALIEGKEICGITFTGSESTGRTIASLAGRHLKKCVLELGGSDPAIITDSADLVLAAEALLASRLNNNGQTCIASKRWIINANIKDALLHQVRLQANNLIYGDPALRGTQLSCMMNKTAYDRLQNQVDRALEDKGVTLETLFRPSQVHPLGALPAILHTKNEPGDWYFEEFFGPVAIVQEYHTIEDAIKLANMSTFGLGATVWTSDEREFHHLSTCLECGNVAWNQVLRSDPSIPFGGIKNSGYGKELGKEGMFEFLNAKYIHF